MPIVASNIITLLKAALDAEGSDYYTDTEDYIPAINQGQSFLVYLINSQIGGKKFAEEYYRELIKSRVFQTSTYSRIDLTPSAITEKVWTILGITAEPTLQTTFSPQNTQGGLSVPRPDLFYVGGGYPCSRLTIEEWVLNADNPFMPGYNVEPSTLNKDYAYLTHVDYNNVSQIANKSPNEIEIRPALSRQPVVVTFVKIPSSIASASDSVEFPESFTDLIVNAALRQIAFKQGDKTTISYLSEKDMITMLQSTF